MIDKKQYALDKWIVCRRWDCHNCPTDDWESLAKCVVCTRNEFKEKLNKKSYFELHKGY